MARFRRKRRGFQGKKRFSRRGKKRGGLSNTYNVSRGGIRF